jgi:outer membrane protein W
LVWSDEFDNEGKIGEKIVNLRNIQLQAVRFVQKDLDVKMILDMKINGMVIIQRLSFILLFALFSSFISAQTNFIDGYIITNEQDTIYGMINFKTDKDNCNRCEFKSAPNVPVKTYLPGEIHAYRFSKVGKYYVSHPITIAHVERNVFLEFLVDGTMDLYYYLDGDKSYYFFENESNQLIALTKKADEFVSKTQYKEDNSYKGVLSYIFRDYPSIEKKINKLEFNRISMVKLTKEYHTLTCEAGQPCIEFENKYEEQYIDLRFNVYAGLVYIQYLFDQETMAEFYNATAYTPTIGAQVMLTYPRITKNLSLVLDFSLTNLNLNTDYSGLFNYFPRNKRDYDYSMQAQMFTGKLGFRYTYLKGNIRPFVEIDGNFTYLFNLSNRLSIKEYTSEDNFYVNEIESYGLLENRFVGYSLNIGLNYRIYKNHFLNLTIGYDHLNYTGDFAPTAQDKMKNSSLKLGYSF